MLKKENGISVQFKISKTKLSSTSKLNTKVVLFLKKKFFLVFKTCLILHKCFKKDQTHTESYCVTCRLNAFFILGVGNLRAATTAGGAATLLGSRSAGGVI